MRGLTGTRQLLLAAYTALLIVVSLWVFAEGVEQRFLRDVPVGASLVGTVALCVHRRLAFSYDSPVSGHVCTGAFARVVPRHAWRSICHFLFDYWVLRICRR
jgi:hypothetical protein